MQLERQPALHPCFGCCSCGIFQDWLRVIGLETGCVMACYCPACEEQDLEHACVLIHLCNERQGGRCFLVVLKTMTTKELRNFSSQRDRQVLMSFMHNVHVTPEYGRNPKRQP